MTYEEIEKLLFFNLLVSVDGIDENIPETRSNCQHNRHNGGFRARYLGVR
jgi:hypothetical protein